ncbi:flavin reductase like domain-containing protein [Hypoxylon cercidicola]|nr:flavin reductase like domain-containing protein [Hypoxylon cercidicola]
MKSLRGLRWALESTTPRYVTQCAPFHTTAKAQVGFLTRWRNPKPAANQQANTPRVNSTLQRHPDQAYETTRSTNPPQHGLGQPMRAVMRQLPHPVVVITTLENTRSVAELGNLLDKKFPRPIPRAMTVSSFTSLSVDPVPRVTFNVTLPSTTYEAIMKCGKFNAHILSGDDHGARIADLFTRGNRPPAATSVSEDGDKPDLGVLAGLKEFGVHVLGQEEWQQEWEQAGEYGQEVLSTVKEGGYITDVELPPSGTLPVLQGQGIMHILKCKFRRLTPPPDSDFEHHAIVMGEVVDIVRGEFGDGYGIALSYADRAYRRLGEKLLERPAPEQVSSTGENADPVDEPVENSDNEKAN